MELFWKSTAGILIAAVLVIVLEKQERDMALLLTILVSTMVVFSALSLLKPVIDFLHQLESIGDIRSDILHILLKVTGIGIVSEMASGICQDSGNSALAHSVKVLGIIVMMHLSLPVFETLIELIQMILGEL